MGHGLGRLMALPADPRPAAGREADEGMGGSTIAYHSYCIPIYAAGAARSWINELICFLIKLACNQKNCVYYGTSRGILLP